MAGLLVATITITLTIDETGEDYIEIEGHDAEDRPVRPVIALGMLDCARHIYTHPDEDGEEVT